MKETKFRENEVKEEKIMPILYECKGCRDCPSYRMSSSSANEHALCIYNGECKFKFFKTDKMEKILCGKL